MEATDFADFSDEALNQYRLSAKISDPLDSEAFKRRLLHQGLLQRKRKKLIPAGYGLLLFGNAPRDIMPQAGLLATIHYPNGKVETRDFDGALVLVPGQIESWLKDKLPNTIDRSRMQRHQSSEIPFEMIREAIVNAVVHRDYDLQGAKCQLIVTGNAIEVRSPGLPVDPITVEQLQSFNAPMLSRNPMLHYVFARMEMAEERGLGLKSLKSHATELGLPLPKYVWEYPYLSLTIYRSPTSAVEALEADIRRLLNADEQKAWQFITTRESVMRRELMENMAFDERKAQRILKKLINAKLLRRVGSGRTTSYEVIR